MAEPHRADWGAGRYELFAHQLQPAAARAVELAEVAAGDRFLDDCCGTGNASALAVALGAGVDGIDLAERLVGVARERVPSARFHVADATALPFADASFDAAVSVFGVIFAPAVAAASELMRVVRPGGRIVVTAWPQDGPIFAAGGLLRRAVAEVAPPAADAPEPTDWHDPAVLAELFAAHDVERHEDAVVFGAASPQAAADLFFDHQPMWLATREIVGEQRYGELRAETAEHFAAINEDPDAWSATASYVAAVVRIGQTRSE